MTTLTELISAVTEIVQDASNSDAEITAFLNRGVLQIAGGVLLPGWIAVTPPLPDLYTIGSVNTSTSAAYVALPTGFQRDLVLCASSAQDSQIEIYSSFQKFVKRFPLLNESGGSVEAVCVKGGNLYYQPIPTSAETLTLHYYCLPTDMSSGADEPSGLPSHLAYQLLTSYAAKEIYALIEDGVEGRKINTEYYLGEFIRGMLDLVHFVGFDGEPATYEDESVYTDDGA